MEESDRVPAAHASWPLTGGIPKVIHSAWAVSCGALLLLFIGGRWLRYTSWSSAPSLNHALRELMVVEQQFFLWPWAYSLQKLPALVLAALVLVLGLRRRLVDGLVRRVDGVWSLTPLAISLLLGTMLWLQYLFDSNPRIALVCFASLVLVWLTEAPRIAAAAPRVVVLGVWGVFIAGALVGVGDASDRLAVVAWTGALVLTSRFLGTRVGRSELFLLRLAAVIPMNLLPALLPLVLPLHGGVRLGDGLGYSFCEVPGRKILYATVPVCDSTNTTYEGCRDSRVVEYDLNSMKRLAARELITPDFYGRLELLACLDDEVEVVVQGAVHHDRNIIQAVLSFPVDSPDHVSLLAEEGGLGATLAYDRQHDAFFYGGEFDNPVTRYDRRTKQFDSTIGQQLVRRWFQPMTLQSHTGSVVLFTSGIHPGRDRLYIADWMQGREVHALDLTTLRVVARYDSGGGGSLGVTVDPDRDRLLVSSVWGLEVFDLKTDALIARKRLGLASRPVVIDAARNRLYVSSLVDGKIRILDRDTLALIGQIPVGFGVRYLQLSLDGRYLFGSSLRAHYYWNADTLP